MPLSNAELPDVKRRVMAMLADTIQTFDLIEQHADTRYGDGARDITGTDCYSPELGPHGMPPHGTRPASGAASSKENMQ
jgi:hypothetical protein